MLQEPVDSLFWRVFGPTGPRKSPVFVVAGLLLVLVVSLAAPAARAQTPELLPDFWVANGDVDAITSGPSDVYVGGSFGWVGPYTGTTVRIDEATGVVSTPPPRVNGSAYAVAPDGAGGWYFGGGFTEVDGIARDKVAHVLSDGRLASWSATFAPAGATLFTMAVSGDRVYIGGDFTAVNGTPRNGVAALDAATGALLPWDPDAGPGGWVFCIVPAGGTVYLGGFFTTMGGLGRGYIAEVDAATGTVTPWNPGADDAVYWIALDGNLTYVGGQFTWIGGQPRNRIAAVDRTTATATGWNPNADGNVRTIAVSGTTVYAGGTFNTIGGASREGLAALSAVTGLATSWDPIGSPPVSHRIYALAVSGNVVFAGGLITEVAGQPRSHLAAIDAVTGLPTAWNPGASEDVWEIAVQGGWVFVCGEFGGAGGVSRNRLAAFDRTSGAATSWDPDADNSVDALAFSNDRIYAGGSFSQVGGQPRTRLAALDLAGAAVPTWNSSTNFSPNALAVAPPDLLVGGTFTLLGGQLRSRVGSVTLDTGATTAWNPGVTAGSNVIALLASGSTAWAGGNFSTIGGANRLNIAALDLTLPTNNALPFNPGASSQVHAFALSGGTLYVGGNFGTLAGQPRSRIGAVGAVSGAIVPGFIPDADTNVFALAVGSTTVFAGGEFTNIGGQPRSRLAGLDPGSGAATAWNPSPGDVVRALHLDGNQLFVGGDFLGISGGWRRGFAAYCLVAPPSGLVATASASPNEIDLTWSGTASSYNVYRSRTSGAGYELIGSTAATSFTDTAAEGGITYFYVVRAVDGCESGPSNEDSAVATGGCGLPPDFEGLAWARPTPLPTCTNELGWATAISPCGGSVDYTVHRDTNPLFVPADSNRLGTVTSTAFNDSFALVPGTTYFYIVRAATASGDSDDNLIRHAATAAGGCTTTLQGVEHLAATATDQNVKLQWKNPPGVTTVVIHGDSSAPCVFPEDPLLIATFLQSQTAAVPGGVETWDHTALTNDETWCYSVFAYDGVSEYSGPRNVRSRPFDSTGKVKWAYSTAASALAAPGIGSPSVIVLSNDRVVHAITRGPGGGVWPAGWIPTTIGGPAQSRPPIVPSPVIPGATQFVLVGSQDGSAYAIDAINGAELWNEPLGDIVQAAPAGIFSAFGSIHDFVLVGTRYFSGTGVFHMLNADDGSVVDSFDNQPPGMGIISGMASVDYANERVYFASRDGGDGRTLWCLDFGTGTLALRWGTPIGDIDGSPVVRGDRVYVGNVAGEVYAVDSDTGGILWTPPFSTGDGQPKGFIFPDHASDDLYFATTNQVWGLSDVGPNASPNFPAVSLPAGARPSVLLRAPGTTWLYVGGSDGRLYQIDVSGPTLDQLTLGEGTAVIGAPTLDRGFIPNMIYVGGDEGVVYGVELPLP